MAKYYLSDMLTNDGARPVRYETSRCWMMKAQNGLSLFRAVKAPQT